ncbi:MAG: DUF465 domain-containing protein [Pseudomonadota bacterium]
MSHVPHELPEMLGVEPAVISARAATDAHFAKEAEAYHQLNRDIHRAETDIEPCSDDHLHELKRKRLALLDELKAALEKS